MNAPEIFTLGENNLLLSAEEVGAIPKLLGAAALANAAPRQSGYAVQAAAINTAGDIVTGGNREYGLSRAYVHGEEAVVSKMLSDYPEVPILGIGMYAEGDSPDQLTPSPCGNCRDVLLEETTPDVLLVVGNKRIAVAARLSTFLFDGYKSNREVEVDPAFDEFALDFAFKEALWAQKRGANVYLPAELQARTYGVALVDEYQNIFSGSLDTTAGYDAITPGVAAIQAFRNRATTFEHKVVPLKAIVIATHGRDVTYRDRNAILELDEVLQSGEDEIKPTRVYIIQTDEKGNALSTLTTDTKEWLPYPFINSSIGTMDAAKTKLQRLVENI